MDVKPSLLANQVMAKLLDTLTNGDETVPTSEDNFFTWCTPGIPVAPSDFDFLERGLTATVRKQDIRELLDLRGTPPAVAGSQPAVAGSQPAVAVSPLLTPAELDKMRGSEAARLQMQAEGLARLVDFIPDVTKSRNERFGRLNVMNNEGSLSDVYGMVLRMSQVMHQDLPDETKKKIEKFRALLNVTKKKKNLIDDSETEVSEPSPLVVAYHEKMQAYMSTALEYNSHRIDALAADNARAVHDWALNANIYREKVRSAMRDWQTNGYKSDYEAIAAFIEQVQARDMALLKEDYKDALQKATLTGIASGSDFFFTSLVPGGFASSNGWTRFTFNSGNYRSSSNSAYSASSSAVSGGGGFLGLFGGSASHSESSSYQEYNGTFNVDNFCLSFEICQVPIVRPWFKTAFLVSKSWRFDPSNPDFNGRMLSDGGATPNGILPAYPTSVIFIRNLHLSIGHSDGFSDYVEEHKRSSSSGGGFLGFGGFFLGGSAGNVSESGRTKRDWGYNYDKNEMVVEGMQIIGYKCHILPKSPNPSKDIKEWI